MPGSFSAPALHPRTPPLPGPSLTVPTASSLGPLGRLCSAIPTGAIRAPGALCHSPETPSLLCAPQAPLASAFPTSTPAGNLPVAQRPPADAFSLSSLPLPKTSRDRGSRCLCPPPPPHPPSVSLLVFAGSPSPPLISEPHQEQAAWSVPRAPGPCPHRAPAPHWLNEWNVTYPNSMVRKRLPRWCS